MVPIYMTLTMVVMSLLVVVHDYVLQVLLHDLHMMVVRTLGVGRVLVNIVDPMLVVV